MPYPTKTDRESILAAAIRQVELSGAESLSIRSVAAELALAPTALYRYFGDRAALESAITAQSSRDLHAALAQATEGKPPLEAFRALARAYMTFARSRPYIYAMVMKQCDACMEDRSSQTDLWKFVLAQVGMLSGEGSAETIAIALWGLLHGMTALDYAPVLANANQDEGFAFGLDALISAIASARPSEDLQKTGSLGPLQ
jgi:AcrR family transcriptional regulator